MSRRPSKASASRVDVAVESDRFELYEQSVPRMRKASVGAMLLFAVAFAAIPWLSSLHLSSGQADAAGIAAVVLLAVVAGVALRWVHDRDVVVFEDVGFTSNVHGSVRWDALAAFEVRRFDWPPRVALLFKDGRRIEFKAASVDVGREQHVAFVERLLRGIERWNAQVPDEALRIRERGAGRRDRWLVVLAVAGVALLAVMAIVAPRSLVVGAPRWSRPSRRWRCGSGGDPERAGPPHDGPKRRGPRQ